MEPDIDKQPCSACSWTPAQQKTYSRYSSNVKLFYVAGDRVVWSMGSRYILKDRGVDPCDFDVRNIRFLQSATTIPMPTITDAWTEDDGRSMVLMERVEGTTLEKAWPNLSDSDKDRIAEQTAGYLRQLRDIQSDRLQGLEGSPLYEEFLFQGEFRQPHGPFGSDNELWKALDQALVSKGIADDERKRLRQEMPPATPYTFTHGDLNFGNIMVKDGNVTGIIDWESSGYFPVWWEFAGSAIAFTAEDKAWKTLLRTKMEDHTAALEFFRGFYRSLH